MNILLLINITLVYNLTLPSASPGCRRRCLQGNLDPFLLYADEARAPGEAGIQHTI